MIFIPVLSWREDASAQKGKKGISRAKLEIFSNLSNSRSGCIQSLDYIKSIARQTSIFIGSLCSASNSDSRTYGFRGWPWLVLKIPCNFSENILTPAHHVILWENEKSTFEGHDDIYSSFLWHFRSASIESFQTIPIFKKSGENRHIRKYLPRSPTVEDALNFKKESGVFLEVLRPKTNIIFKFNFLWLFWIDLTSWRTKMRRGFAHSLLFRQK